MLYIVVNIGCIECGVSSGIVGIYDDRENANAAAAECTKHLAWRQYGQNKYQVFQIDLTTINTMNPQYENLLKPNT